MRHIKEILRLKHSLQLSVRQIARSCGLPSSTVNDYLARAQAADGHWHKAAAHDQRHDGSKMAVGHFYSLDLRTHMLRHLAAGEGWHEHDLSDLKRIKPKGLRQGVPQGKRVLVIYDKAAIDFVFGSAAARSARSTSSAGPRRTLPMT